MRGQWSEMSTAIHILDFLLQVIGVICLTRTGAASLVVMLQFSLSGADYSRRQGLARVRERRKQLKQVEQEKRTQYPWLSK